ncbi:MAG: DUF1549 domain-containing protein, partial [Planctomycetales bacterium]|nr:DUF1549 domain-containing protein [Planctomycetales bacterium]
MRLDIPVGLLESGAVVPGKPDESELIRRVRLPRNHDEVMPAVGETLSREQVVALERWIAAGAKWPEDFETPRHWSLASPRKAPLPTPDANDPDRQWPRRPIDFFALKRMRDAGLRPSPPAAPETLLRRLYLDLTGLPPTPAELDRFLADPSDVAYEQVVDQLLQRPQFGERWARPWLDLARYADSHGFQRDDLREVWAYRDWVIRALNEDMPFDRFTIEQLAGDLLPDATESQRIATGFHRCTPTNVEAGSLPEETRTEQLIDRVNTTGAIWLGVTMECAQCHDHKYDPFTMKDYYQLLAFFNNTEIEADRANPQQPSSIRFIGPSMPLANPRQSEQREQLQSTMGDLKRQQTLRQKALANDLDQWAQQLADASRHAPMSHALEVLEFRSLGKDDPHRILDDGSVLLTGSPPDKDVYTVTVQLRHDDIRALRIDALTHEKLPGKGPGRGDPVRRNFILSEFTAELDG